MTTTLKQEIALKELSAELEEHSELVFGYIKNAVSVFIQNSKPSLTPDQLAAIGSFSAFLMSGAKVESIPTLMKSVGENVTKDISPKKNSNLH